MKNQSLKLILIGILQATIILLASYTQKTNAAPAIAVKLSTDPLQNEALEILETKCNVCHRKKNPFMVFNEKNMSKRAPKIYKMVYVERKMPKGDEIKLTNEEYVALEKWLFTQSIY
ncbi:MAG: hypothetical protein HRT61_21660 [Ekhidna sp.]|nr:hypothetical protein [Ekhidna sp.]